MKMSIIMSIDDSKGDQLLNEMAIHNFNPEIEIIEAFDGQEALDLLDNMEKQPDLILLDINMPGMGGIEFLAHYNKREIKTTIVAMLTSSEQEKDKVSVSQYPCVKAYFAKPLTQENLTTFLDT
jgi:CheY-like chemotaxis protein